MPTQVWLQRSRARRELRARYRVEAHAEPHPAGTEVAVTTALSLAHERFVEKRASGSRPRRVVRRSCLRPRGGVRIRPATTPPWPRTSAAPGKCRLPLSRSSSSLGDRYRGARDFRSRTKAATRSSSKTWPELVQSSSRRPTARPALGDFRSACVSSHAGDGRRRCWSGRKAAGLAAARRGSRDTPPFRPIRKP